MMMARRAMAADLAAQVQRLLSGARPANEKEPDRQLYDNLVSIESPLFDAVDPGSPAKPRLAAGGFGLDRARFGSAGTGGPGGAASLTVAATSVRGCSGCFPLDFRLAPAGSVKGSWDDSAQRCSLPVERLPLSTRFFAID